MVWIQAPGLVQTSVDREVGPFSQRPFAGHDAKRKLAVFQKADQVCRNVGFLGAVQHIGCRVSPQQMLPPLGYALTWLACQSRNEVAASGEIVLKHVIALRKFG